MEGLFNHADLVEELISKVLTVFSHVPVVEVANRGVELGLLPLFRDKV